MKVRKRKLVPDLTLVVRAFENHLMSANAVQCQMLWNSTPPRCTDTDEPTIASRYAYHHLALGEAPTTLHLIFIHSSVMGGLLEESVRAGIDVTDFLLFDRDVCTLAVVIIVVGRFAGRLALLAGCAVIRLRRTTLSRLGCAGRTRYGCLLGCFHDTRRTDGPELQLALDLAERDGGTTNGVLERDQ